MSDSLHYHNTKETKTILIRVSKSDSSLVYFIFESNENLAFYSTLPSSLGETFRDIEINTTPEFYYDVKKQLDYLGKSFNIEILEESSSL